jgi:alpha-1,3-rhamnosyltransferase
MKHPLVSVAIPAYNHAHYIDACLTSVYKQTYPNIELVVIDDGSTDETRTLIEDFLSKHAARFANTIFRSRPNQGVSVTSNEAIGVCSGEWVHLLGSDDVIYPDKILRQSHFIQTWNEPSLALVYADANYLDETGRILPKSQEQRPAPGPNHAAYLSLFLQNPITNPTLAIKRDAFLNLGGFDETLQLEDWDCWLRLSTKYAIARVPEILAGYRYHPLNTSRNQHLMLHAMLLTFAKFLEMHGKLIPTKVRKESFRKNLHRLYRWAKNNDPTLLLSIGADMLTTPFRTPEARDYRRYAEKLCRHIQ